MIQDKRELIRQILADLETKTGRLTPDAVVTLAAHEDSPLHEHFEWDDSKAAHAHRLDQARSLITSVKVEVRTEHRTISTVCYIRDPAAKPNEQGYVAVTKLRGERDLAREATIDAFRQARSMMERAKNISTALSIEDDIELIIDDISRLHTIVETQTEARH